MMGVSMVFGAVIATIVIEYKSPRIAIGIMALFYLIGGIQGLFISDDLENNEKANVKDQELIIFQKQ